MSQPIDPSTPPSAGRSPIEVPTFAPPPAPPGGYGYAPQPPAPEPRRPGFLGRIVTGVVSSLVMASLALNAYFLVFFSAQLSAGVTEKTFRDGDAEQRIVVMRIEGVIGSETAGYVRAALEHLRSSPPKALVLRINSPGGGLTASDQIERELRRFRDDTKVPLIASLGAVAASGGYYIAAPCDTILAEPTTITGSIGVISQAFTVEKLLQKLGVEPQTLIARGSQDKDVLDITRAWNDRDRATLLKFLDRGYERFVSVVKAGRGAKLTDEDLKKGTTGAPLAADEAIALHLVDSTGYIEDAIDQAALLAKLPKGAKPRVTLIKPAVSIVEAITGRAPGHGPGAAADLLNPAVARQWASELATPSIECRWVGFSLDGSAPAQP